VTIKPFTTIILCMVFLRQSRQNSRRNELIELFYQVQKEKRDLRKRNAQAQTNISLYYR